MRIIESSKEKNFINAVPQEIIELANEYIAAKGLVDEWLEFIVLFGGNYDKVKASCDKEGLKCSDLGYGFGILAVKANEIGKTKLIEGIQYIEFPKVFKTNDMQSNIASCVNSVWENSGLTGKGVLIGIIDTGIDYKHPCFTDFEGKTRIKYIYDLENEKVYSEENINTALSLEDPDSIIPVQDLLGHGTAVASVAAGGGKGAKKENYGVAYEASIIMVKITQSNQVNTALGTQVMRGFKFLIDKAKELNMPLVINLSLSSNDGAHNGRTLAERYIDEIAKNEKVAIVVAAGNEASEGHHYSGVLIEDEHEVFFNVGAATPNVRFQLYKFLIIDISIELISPSGQTTGKIPVKKGVRNIGIGKNECIFYCTGPKPFDIDGECIVNLINKKAEYVEEGQWILKIYKDSDIGGVFDVWLPITAIVGKGTKFLYPDPYNTVGIPSTVKTVISVGSYNASLDNFSYFSGRGVEQLGKLIKPDVLAPGENINAALAGGGFQPETGTSVAAPQVAGGAALLMQWGLVEGNDSYLYGDRLKYYLIRGARRVNKELIYPNRNFGYGYFCLNKSLQLASEESGNEARDLKSGGGFEVKKNEDNEKNIMIENQARKNKKSQKDKENQNDKNIKVDSQNNKENFQKENLDVKSKDEVEKSKEQDIEKENLDAKLAGETFYEKPIKKSYYECKKTQSTTKQYYLNDGFIDFLVQYESDIIGAVEKYNDFASAFTIDESYAIVSSKIDKISFISGLKEIIYIDSGGVYTLQNISPIEASKASSFQYNPYLTLTGRGTLVGIIDTGIDYLNNEFINADNTTNIIRIWDQSQRKINTSEDVFFGAEYTKEDINKALALKAEGKDPFTIVNTRDEKGHGTAMAGVIAGRGNNNSIRGIAADAKIAMVKLKPADDSFKNFYASTNFKEAQYRNTDILLGIRYLFGLAREMNMPMVIYIPLGTTVGGHDGTSVIERYIDDLSDSSGILFVTSTGNEGIGENHTSGQMSKVGDTHDIELQIGEGQESIFMTIYAKAPDRYDLGVLSPSGEFISSISPKQKNGVNMNFVYEGTSMNILFIEPSELTGDQVIVITAKNIKPGIWTFKLKGEYIIHGKYHSWLLQRKLLDPNTKFIKSTPETTLTIPSTAYNVIAVSSYNQNNTSMMSTSGRGRTRDERQAPLIAAGGMEAILGAPGNSKQSLSGGSVAGAIVTGCCLQLLQWGVVEGHDKTMYVIKVQTYLMRGTDKRKSDKYPNEIVGYGTLNMKELITQLGGSAIGSPKGYSDAEFSLKSISRGSFEEDEDACNEERTNEFNYRGLYIRQP
ncbi:MAG: S8 family serine peptidase [Sarcina sp.]